MILKVKHITKRYKDILAVDDVSLESSGGRIYGLLGRNGAGKTTLIKTIMGIIKPDNGNVEIKFEDNEKGEKSIGYLPEERGLYLNISVKDQLLFIARLNGLSKEEAMKNISFYLKELGISNYLDRKLKQLSKGNKQKIQLISALIHNPSLIILDEPFSGLDPVNVAIFKNLILKCRDSGKLILLSSHRLEDVEEICDEVLFLKKGKAFIQGPVKQITKDYTTNNDILIITDTNADTYFKKLDLIYRKTDDCSYFVKYEFYGRIMKLLNELLLNNINLVQFKIVQTTLNDIFVRELNDENEKSLIGS
ncbi:ATP-binding cassette domain-containing protein [Anaerocolumna aminovalerica]|uniref:ABC-2 type transport system ATP-binding protein n=1 Tax=Anaerocolumna aminovalerica TaxID=1527 RepID=A0A1I5F5M4_9FIRM|nr:ATP-binding cassette domain-containing protein [Anaerocolumna aminovalerica]MBU5333489.1 ATP-binding cassette domain-containing protein [Anaerocolumna aminovalerica]MDU6264927.1 ATP-binding cassette domain-containing protein [Anaerocolumna aminovalerica]SFO19034.1 ABC-2 type transport system ATP-binding protein [Anaerocolumna aminovalerica]